MQIKTDPIAEARRRDSLQRLAAAAALEEACGMKPVQAWQLAAALPEGYRLQLVAANRNRCRAMARAEAIAVVRRFRAVAAAVSPAASRSGE